jgi:hypothetical protein
VANIPVSGDKRAGVTPIAAGEPGARLSLTEPSPPELADALSFAVGADGAVPAGVTGQLRRDHGWGGRLVDVLEVITENPETMGYLAGGRRPDEVATWLSLWASSPLSLEEIRLVVSCGGWDPEPFVPLARAGLLEKFLRLPDGSPRRIRGELAGGWASDELALAGDEEVLRRVTEIIGDNPPASKTDREVGSA